MKKLLKIRFNNQKAYYENGKIYTNILPKPIEVLRIYPDGSYLGHYNFIKVYLKKTPKGDYYTNLGGKVIDPLCFVSEKLDAVFCLVSRNANTSVVLSGMYAEGHTDLENYPNEKFLWHDEELNKILKEKGYLKKLSEINHKNYKHHYLIFDDPYKRYIRALNKILVEDSLFKVDEHLKKKGKEKEFIDEMLYFSDLAENDEHFIWERHIGLQDSFMRVCERKYPIWEVIKLKEVGEWWEKTFNSKWLRNNISRDNQKRIKLEDFTSSQREKLDKYLERDVKIWNKFSKEL